MARQVPVPGPALGSTVVDLSNVWECHGSRGVEHRLEPSATARASHASVEKHLINHRLGKRQQMRWTPAGAHYLMQVRVNVLNGTLLKRSRRTLGTQLGVYAQSRRLHGLATS
jgi:hypothetical protein